MIQLTPPALVAGGAIYEEKAMKQKIPAGAAIAIVVIIGVLIVFFGWRKVTGGADADVTQETINRYQNMSKQTFGGGGSPGAGGAGQMTHGAPPANAPGAGASK